VMGIAAVRGHPAFPLELAAHELVAALVRGVKSNNYRFLRQTLMLGWVSPERSEMCHFSFFLETHGETFAFRGASLLHYALCCSSFEAAAALLIAQPALVDARCSIAIGKKIRGNLPYFVLNPLGPLGSLNSHHRRTLELVLY